MMENRIGLYIGGTASSVGGYGDLVSINFDIEKFGIRDVSYDSAFNSYYYVVEHTQYGIIYSYIYNPNAVYAYGSSRAGRLQMNFFIPRGYKLTDNLSPLDLIHEVRDTFVNLYMNIYAGKCQFKDVTEFSEELFWEILNRYEIIPSRRYIPMSGSLDARYFLGDEEKLSQFLQDTQYAEFAAYKSIKISTSSNSALRPVPVAIPRTVKYAVIINGKQYGAVDATNSFNTMCTEVGPSAKYCDSVNVRFSLSDIAEGRNIALDNHKAECVVIRIDEIGERIELRVVFPKKEFKRLLIVQLDSFNTNKDEIIEALGNCTLCLAEKSKQLTVDPNSLSVPLSFVGEEIDDAWSLRSARPSQKFDFIVDIPKSIAGSDCIGSIKVERKFVGIALDKVPDAFCSNPPKLILNGSEYSFQEVDKSQKMLMSRVVNLAKSNVKNLALQKSGYSFDSITVPPSPLDSKGYLHFPFPGFRKVQQGGAVNLERKDFEGNYLTVRNIVKNVTVIVCGQSSMKISMISDGNKLEIPLLASFKPEKVSFVKKGYRTESTNSIELARQGGYSVKMPELCEISFWENALTYLKKVLPVLLIALLLGFGAGLFVQKKIQLLNDSGPERTERRSGDKDKGLFRIFGKNGRNTDYHATNNTDPQTNGQENSDTTCQDLITQDVNETEGGVSPDYGEQQGYAGHEADDTQQILFQQAASFRKSIESADMPLSKISDIRSWVTQNNTSLSSNEDYQVVAEGIAFYETANSIIESLINGTCSNLTDVVQELYDKTNERTCGKYQKLRDQLNALKDTIPDSESPKPGRAEYYLEELMSDKTLLSKVNNINQLLETRKSYLQENKTEWKKNRN